MKLSIVAAGSRSSKW